MADRTVHLRLYVTGQSPNSRQASRNLELLCRDCSPERYEVEVIDLLEEPGRALEDRVLMTPMLLIDADGQVQRIIGNLSDPEPVRRALEVPTDGSED